MSAASQLNLAERNVHWDSADSYLQSIWSPKPYEYGSPEDGPFGRLRIHTLSYDLGSLLLSFESRRDPHHSEINAGLATVPHYVERHGKKTTPDLQII